MRFQQETRLLCLHCTCYGRILAKSLEGARLVLRSFTEMNKTHTFIHNINKHDAEQLRD